MMEKINSHCGFARDGRGVVSLWICDAGPLTILNSQVIDGVREGLRTLAGDDSVRVLIVRGEGERSLIGGADIREMATLDQGSAEVFISRLRDLCEDVRNFPVPVIARLPGWCLGAGLEFAAACDFRIAAPDAKFSMPEVRVGIPSVIHAALLPRLIGWGRARWLILTAATIDAPTALVWGLIDAVSGTGRLDDAVEEVVASILQAGPQAIRSQKALLRQWEDLPLKDAIDRSVRTFGEAYLTGEPQRMMQDFLNRPR